MIILRNQDRRRKKHQKPLFSGPNLVYTESNFLTGDSKDSESRKRFFIDYKDSDEIPKIWKIF